MIPAPMSLHVTLSIVTLVTVAFVSMQLAWSDILPSPTISKSMIRKSFTAALDTRKTASELLVNDDWITGKAPESGYAPISVAPDFAIKDTALVLNVSPR